MILVPSDVEHTTIFPTAMRGAAIWIDRDVVREVADAIGKKSGAVPGVVANGARIAKLGAVLAEEARGGDRGALLAIDALVEAILVAALRTEASANEPCAPRDPAIANAIRFIEAT